MTKQHIEHFTIRSGSDRLRAVSNAPGFSESRRSGATADGARGAGREPKND